MVQKHLVEMFIQMSIKMRKETGVASLLMVQELATAKREKFLSQILIHLDKHHIEIGLIKMHKCCNSLQNNINLE